MRKEGLDPKGKVELARMLIQIGFEAEGVAEYLMAAQMYEERGEHTRAIELYEKVLNIDKDNNEANRGLYRLKPRSTEQIDNIVAKMGLAPKPAPPTEEEKPAQKEHAAPPTVESEPGPQAQPESTSPPVSDTPAPEPTPAQVVDEPRAQEAPSGPLDVTAISPEVSEVPGKDTSAHKNIDEQLATLIPLLADMPDDTAKRTELGDFFRDEGLYSEAFFEIRGTYIYEPSVEKLSTLISLLNDALDRKALISFLHTESLLERPRDVAVIVLEKLANTYDEEEMPEEAQETRAKLKELESKPAEVKKSNVKIIEDKPRLQKPAKESGKNQSGPIQFI